MNPISVLSTLAAVRVLRVGIIHISSKLRLSGAAVSRRVARAGLSVRPRVTLTAVTITAVARAVFVGFPSIVRAADHGISELINWVIRSWAFALGVHSPVLVEP